ncbi:MAG: hypothetical protein ACP5H2_12560 [Solirubrobacteraceae bacterium]
MAVGEQMRPGRPLGDDPEPVLVGLGETQQRLVDAGEVRGAAVHSCEQHPDQEGTHPRLAGADPNR